jgi:MFS family permease
VADRTALGLDGLNFFMANVQTGFGPFIAAYLASQAWTQGEIGFALSVGTVTFMAAQVPAGALVDAVRNKRTIAGAAVLAIVASALLLALFPARLPVFTAEVLHGLASCVMTPAIAALSLAAAGGAAGHAFGERLGRNARFASIGSGVAAAVMGAVGYWVSERAVFLLAGGLALPAMFTLRLIRAEPASTGPPPEQQKMAGALLDRRLLLFALCCFGFHLANAAMFPFAAVRLTREGGNIGELVIAACLVVPQMLVAVISPWVGRYAQERGRRRILLIGFAAVPLRGALFALLHQPVLIVMAQALDGVSGAVFGVLLPLVVADITRGTGRFNLSMGAVGLAIGAGATASTGLAGVVADRFHSVGAFIMLTGIGIAVVGLLWAAMPETGPALAPRTTSRRFPGLRLRRR